MALRAVLLAVAVALVVAEPSNVVYIESDLPLEFAGEIHPYAYSYMLPEPHYRAAHFSGRAEDFNSFLELQDHVLAGSEEAKLLTVTPEAMPVVSEPEPLPSLLETGADSQFISKIAGAVKTMLSSKGASKAAENSPSAMATIKLNPHPSQFWAGNQYDAGVFKNSYRRAVYGVRRRRMPFTLNALTQTLNPFRRPNHLENTPQDVLFPRQRMMQALNPQLTDIGRFGGPEQTAYGGYSSFRVFRHQEPQPGSIGGLGVQTFPSPIGQAAPVLGMDPRMIQRPAHPMGGGPSPYIPGMEGKFFDFYTDGKKAGGGEEEEEKEF